MSNYIEKDYLIGPDYVENKGDYSGEHYKMLQNLQISVNNNMYVENNIKSGMIRIYKTRYKWDIHHLEALIQ